MAHNGGTPYNLFINGALSPGHHHSSGRVIHHGLGPDTDKIDVLPHSDLNVRQFKAGTKRCTWFRVSCRWPQAHFPPLFYFHVHAGTSLYTPQKHSLCVCGELICWPSILTIPHFVCPVSNVPHWFQTVWVTRDETSMQVSFFTFSFSYSGVMSCLFVDTHTLKETTLFDLTALWWKRLSLHFYVKIWFRTNAFTVCWHTGKFSVKMVLLRGNYWAGDKEVTTIIQIHEVIEHELVRIYHICIIQRWNDHVTKHCNMALWD